MKHRQTVQNFWEDLPLFPGPHKVKLDQLFSWCSSLHTPPISACWIDGLNARSKFCLGWRYWWVNPQAFRRVWRLSQMFEFLTCSSCLWVTSVRVAGQAIACWVSSDLNCSSHLHKYDYGLNKLELDILIGIPSCVSPLPILARDTVSRRLCLVRGSCWLNPRLARSSTFQPAAELLNPGTFILE